MEPSMILAIAVFVFLLVTVAQGVRQVPQGFKWVVQRLGKYSSTLNPGLNFIIPYIDTVAFKVTTKDIVLDIPSQEVIRAEVQILSNFQMPWGMRYPMIFNHLSGIILLRKNLSNNTQVTSDNLGIVHLATTAYLKKLNFSPFIQFQSHQLLLQSVDGSNSSKRWLATGTLGIDISVGFHIVKNWSIRFGTPIYTWSSRNGFPDGTFPGMFMGVSYGFDGVLATENH